MGVELYSTQRVIELRYIPSAESGVDPRTPKSAIRLGGVKRPRNAVLEDAIETSSGLGQSDIPLVGQFALVADLSAR